MKQAAFACIGFLGGLLAASAAGLLLDADRLADPRAVSPGAAGAEEVAVATVDGVPIDARSLGEEMGRRQRLVPGLFDDPAERRALLDERIRFETLVARAREAGYADDPQLVREWKRLLARRYESEHLEPRIAALQVSDEEIQRYYQENRESYVRPERRRVSLVLLELSEHASSDRVAEQRRRAGALLAEARGLGGAPPADFAGLARERSDHRASRYVGGDVGWVTRGQRSYRFAPAVVEAMFALEEPGELSPVVRGPEGFYVLKLTEKEPARPRPLDEIRPALRHALLDAKRTQLVEDFHADLAERTRVEIDAAALEALEPPEEIVRADDARRAPPRLPGG